MMGRLFLVRKFRAKGRLDSCLIGGGVKGLRSGARGGLCVMGAESEVRSLKRKAEETFVLLRRRTGMGKRRA